MTERDFTREMRRASAMQRLEGSTYPRADYWQGYQRGLRRAYHGEDFGTEDEHALWLSLADEEDDRSRRARGEGYRDGLACGGYYDAEGEAPEDTDCISQAEAARRAGVSATSISIALVRETLTGRDVAGRTVVVCDAKWRRYLTVPEPRRRAK
jgi:hypothetical protein